MNILFEEINNVFKINLPMEIRKICDLKPAYGEIFKENIKTYDFWGFADLDIIWGNIEQFIEDNILDNFDILTSREKNIAGHFTLLRNTKKINELYKKVPDYKKLLEKEKFQWFDELHFNNYIKKNIKDIKIYWENNLLNVENNFDSQQDYHLDLWMWKNGDLINTETKEGIMYLHFINWKKYLKINEVKFKKNVDYFFISYNKIHFNNHSKIQINLNKIKNFFIGFWIRIYLKKKIKNFKRIIKSYSGTNYNAF